MYLFTLQYYSVSLLVPLGFVWVTHKNNIEREKKDICVSC